MRSPAEILGISPAATHDEARRAYRALAKRWHPDRFMPGPEREWANEHMTEINTAYAAFTRNAPKAQPAADLSSVRRLIEDGKLSSARELLMTMPTRCAEWNYLFGTVLMRLADYSKALMYLSVASHQDPGNKKYAAACVQAQEKKPARRLRFFR